MMAAASTRKSNQVRTRGAVAPVGGGARVIVAIVVIILASTCLDRPASAAGAPEPARVRLAAALVDDLVRRLLPFEILLAAPLVGPADAGAPAPSTPAAVTITDLLYCGATDKGNGRWRAFLRTGPGAGMQPPMVVAADDACRQNLEELSRHLAEGRARDDGTCVADVEAVWRPWEVRLVVVRLVGAGAAKPGGPRPLAPMENRRDLLAVSTANFRVVTDGGETLTFHVAPLFMADAIDLAVFLGENGVGPPGGRPAVGGHIPVLSEDMTVAAELPYAFANQILRQLTATHPLAVPVDRDVIDVQNVNTAGAVGGLTVTGIATPRGLRESARLTVQAGGDEARVSAIRAEAQLESCAGLGTLASIGCGARNAARSAAAAALAAALTQKYQGQLVRELAGPQTMRFDLGGRRLELQGDIMHVTAGSRTVGAGARLSARGGADH